MTDYGYFVILWGESFQYFPFEMLWHINEQLILWKWLSKNHQDIWLWITDGVKAEWSFMSLLARRQLIKTSNQRDVMIYFKEMVTSAVWLVLGQALQIHKTHITHNTHN